MPVTGAHHTSYTVSDMEQMLAFYRDLLGFEVIQNRPEVTAPYFRTIVGIPDCVVHAVMMKIPGTEHHLELFEYKHPRGTPQDLRPNNPGSSHISYFVDDLNAMYVRLRKKGVSFLTEPVYLEEGPNSGGWAVYARDPDSILIELFQLPL